MRRIIAVGGKTVQISTDGVPEGKVEIIERDLGVQRRLVLSLFEAEWFGGVLYRIHPTHRWGRYASLRGGARQLEISRGQNRRGEYVVASIFSLTVRGRICIPASEFGTGWNDLASVLIGLVQGARGKERSKTGGWRNTVPHNVANIKPREKMTYAQAAYSGRWPEMCCEVQPMVGEMSGVGFYTGLGVDWAVIIPLGLIIKLGLRA